MNRFGRIAGAFAVTALAAGMLTTGPASAATDIKVAVGPYAEMGAIQYAVDTRIFAKNGLNVTELTVFPAPFPALQALAGGSVQFAYAPITPVLNAYVNGGVNYKIVSPGHGFSPTQLAKAKKDLNYAKRIDNVGVCVPNASPIQSFKDLEGKTVSVPARNAQAEITVANLIKKAGGDPKKVNWVTLTFPETVPAAASGRVDAAYTLEPFLGQCAGAGLRNIGSPGVLFLDAPAVSVWVTTAQYAEANPAVVKAFQKSIAQANAFANATRANAIKTQIAATKVTGVSPDVASKQRSIYYPIRLTKLDIQSQADKMFDLGYLRSPVNVSALLLSQYR